MQKCLLVYLSVVSNPCLRPHQLWYGEAPPSARARAPGLLCLLSCEVSCGDVSFSRDPRKCVNAPIVVPSWLLCRVALP